jgi:hypothetical protein
MIEHRWIPVENKLPNPRIGERITVLASDGRIVFEATYYLKTYNALTEDATFAWETKSFEASSELLDMCITHWQPMPSPPQIINRKVA